MPSGRYAPTSSTARVLRPPPTSDLRTLFKAAAGRILTTSNNLVDPHSTLLLLLPTSPVSPKVLDAETLRAILAQPPYRSIAMRARLA